MGKNIRRTGKASLELLRRLMINKVVTETELLKKFDIGILNVTYKNLVVDGFPIKRRTLAFYNKNNRNRTGMCHHSDKRIVIYYVE